MSEANSIIWSTDSYHDSNSRGASLDDTSAKEDQDDITNDTIIEDLLVKQEDSPSLDNNQDFINYNHDFDLGVDASTVNKKEECDSKKKNVKDTAVYCGPIQDEQDEMSSLSLESDDDDSIPYQVLSPSSMDNYYRQSLDDRDCLGAILPAMESVIRDMVAQELHTKSESMIPTAGKTSDAFRRESQEIDYSMDPTIDMNNTSISEATNTNLKNVSVNNLGPREQEEADEPVRKGMRYLFDNKFLKAKTIFQTKSNSDPLYALGLGAMTFIKAIMTFNQDDMQVAVDTLTSAYNIAKYQIDYSTAKKPTMRTSSISSYFTSLVSPNTTGLPLNPPSSEIHTGSDGKSLSPTFIPNGVLRANVIRAECCLLIGMLQMTQESVVGYLKCGLNLKKAYSSYTIVWQEYKRMGQEYTKYMDRDTVSAVQFGIGTVHLLLSSLPPKILKILSILGFKSDKNLGFALLKLCLEGRGIRSPLASLMLLTYYSILSSFVPQIYAKELIGPAVECLVDAQRNHPSSCFFLFYAARISRVARNIPLSTQSFSFAAESSKGEWAEMAMHQMADYETGFNYVLQLDWASAAIYFEKLSRDQYYWSPAFCQYFIAACKDMMGHRTESILAFAEVTPLVKKSSYIDAYVQEKVEFFQRSGYQDIEFSLPGLEILLVWNAFEQMEKGALEQTLSLVQVTLERIYEREKLEYNIRLKELAPSATPPDYYDQRSILLLIKASVLNALKRHNESIAHLNWIMDHKKQIKSETWVIPFTYWESGVTSWGLGNYAKSRKLWELALSCTKYTFEYRMAVRLSLALSKCDEIGISVIDSKKQKGLSTNGRKRMAIIGV